MLLRFRYFKEKITDAFLFEGERFFLWLPVFFALGVVSYFYFPFEPSFVHTFMMLLAGVFLFFDSREKPILQFFSMCFFMTVSGFFITQAHVHFLKTPMLKVPVSGVVVQGEVLSANDTNGVVVLKNVNILNHDVKDLSKRINLVLKKSDASPEKGDYIRVKANLFPISKPLMPMLHAVALRSFFNQTGSRAYALENITRFENLKKRTLLSRCQKHIKSFLKKHSAYFDITQALVLGNSSSISKERRKIWQTAGIAHLLAVSGVHLGLVSGLFFAFFSFVFAFFPSFALRFSALKAGAVASLIFSFLYVLLSGSSVSTIRAFAMVAFIMTGILTERRVFSLLSLSWALFFVLFFWPETVLNAGFQMSFSAAYALVALNENEALKERKFLFGFKKINRRVMKAMKMTLIASLATAPFSLSCFNAFPLYGLLGNMYAGFLSSFVVMPALMLGVVFSFFPELGGFFVRIADKGIGIIDFLSVRLTQFPSSMILVPQMTQWGLFLSATGLFWLCLWQGKKRYIGIVGIIAGVVSAFFNPRFDVFVSDKGNVMAFKGDFNEMYVSDADDFQSRIWLQKEGKERFHEKGCFSKKGCRGKTFSFYCKDRVCFYEKNGVKTAITRKISGAVSVCREKNKKTDILLSPAGIPKGCFVKQTHGQRDFYANGAHFIRIDKSKKADVVSGTDKIQNRPWSSSFHYIEVPFFKQKNELEVPVIFLKRDDAG